MKKIKISKILISFSVLAAIACSKTEENVPLTQPTAEVTVDKIVRKASLRNQVIPFSILNEAGEDVTDASTFYVDGQEVDGNVFSSPIIGEFEVFSSFQNVHSLQYQFTFGSFVESSFLLSSDLPSPIFYSST